MRDGDDRALEAVERLLERLGAVDVEVVRRLVEQQQVVALELEAEDLQARLLAARQRLVAAGAPRRRGRSGPAPPSAACTRARRARRTTSSTTCPAKSSRALSWVNSPGDTRVADRRTSPSCSTVVAGQQPDEVRLARPVGADQARRARRSGPPRRTAARARRCATSRRATTRRALSPPRRRTLMCWSTTGGGRRPVVDEALPARLRRVGLLRDQPGGVPGALLEDALKSRKSRRSSSFQRSSRSPISSWRCSRASG